ncbi:MAG: hypothetical protein EOO39_50460 [Cytophagaceae bacterium]|nr:MAG: hypothetical protein EOO39_50460 [Cytophagaceae bacterium]
MATTTHADGHGHGATTRLHEDLPHYSEFHTTHPPTSLFHLTALGLTGLLILTVGLYYVDLSEHVKFIPGINLIVALLVAIVKAFLVVRNFMNLRGATKLTVLWAALGFIWLLLMGGIFLDYRTRPASPGWQTLHYPLGEAPQSTSKTVIPE